MTRCRPLAIPALVLGFILLLPACGEPHDPTVKETPIRMLSETEGVGRAAKKGDLVTINYRIRLEDGRDILSDRGYRFVIGSGSVIAGIDEAVEGMRVSGKREFLCPPHRHWGRGGYSDKIPIDETLTIALDLQAIN